jgi:molybdate transport system substrate-binding protein
VKAIGLLAAGVLLAACGPAPGPTPPLQRDLNVFAAASLTESFTALARSFEFSHPMRVHLDFAGSPTLVEQIQQGAPADLFASADLANMRKLTDSGAAGTPVVFARNKLEIVVARGNPRHISGLADLANPDLVVVLAAPGVPAGTYARQALEQAGVKVTPRSEEQDVKSVVSKVALGEADAGIVYVTDLRAGGPKVEGVAIPDADNVVASYPLAVLKNAPNPNGARTFERFVLSPPGQHTLATFGFESP